MPYLFDTDAISELLKAGPSPGYVRWLSQVQPENQFTSAIVIGELFRRAFRSAATARHLKNIESRVLPSVVVLPYDVAVARVYGEIHATLSTRGDTLADADVQIAAHRPSSPPSTRDREPASLPESVGAAHHFRSCR